MNAQCDIYPYPIAGKCRKYNFDLYQIFIDLEKAFESVNRKALWVILGKLGYLDIFVKIVQPWWYKIWVNVNVELTGSLCVENGEEQREFMVRMLFSKYFVTEFSDVFGNCSWEAFFKYRNSGNRFRLSRIKAKLCIFMKPIKDFLFCESWDCDFLLHIEIRL